MEIYKCRMCTGTDLFEFLDLGYTPPADSFLANNKKDKTEIYYPLSVLMCNDCGLAQLSHVVAPEILYCNEYPYDCSVTSSGRAHWDSFAKNTIEKLRLKGEQFVVDIGCNVGVLLQAFKAQGMKVLGVEPANNISEIANKRGIPTEISFFSPALAKKIVKKHGQANLITATNVFAHINDLNSFFEGINILLAKKGHLILEFPYLKDLLENLAYDTIYHEHLSYFAVKPLKSYLTSLGFTIHQIEHQKIHGGSLRLTIARSSEAQESAEVSEYIRQEIQGRIFDKTQLITFSEKVQKNRTDLTWLLHSLKHSGKKIAGISAPAKGMTLLNYCGIGTNLLEFISEKTPLKIGRFTPGLHIPIVSDEELIDLKPDYCLLLAWNFKDEIMKNLSTFSNQGGKFIIPLPEPVIL